MSHLKEQPSGTVNYGLKAVVFVLLVTLLQITLTLYSYSTLKNQTQIEVQKLLAHKEKEIFENIERLRINTASNSPIYRSKRDAKDDVKQICNTIDASCPMKGPIGPPGIPGARGMKGDPGNPGLQDYGTTTFEPTS